MPGVRSTVASTSERVTTSVTITATSTTSTALYAFMRVVKWKGCLSAISLSLAYRISPFGRPTPSIM